MPMDTKMPIDPVEVIWLSHFSGPRFRSNLIGAIDRYGRKEVASALIAHVRAFAPNVISIAAAPNWAGDLVMSRRGTRNCWNAGVTRMLSLPLR